MKKQLSIILFLVAFLSNNTFFAQNFADREFYLVDSLVIADLITSDKEVLDSNLTKYHETKEDTLKLKYLNKLISDCGNDIWVKYNILLFNKVNFLLSKEKDKTKIKTYKEYLSFTHNNRGYYYFNLHNDKKAIEHFKKAIEISENIGKKYVIATALNNIGYIYKQQGDILKALDYYHQSLKLNKELNEEVDIALALNNIGGIYYSQNELEKALKYFREALIIEKRSGKKRGEARLYSNIGSVYMELNRVENAKEYFEYSIKKYTEIEDDKGVANSLAKLALLELENLPKEGGNEKALKKILLKQKQAYQVYLKKDLEKEKANILSDMGETYKVMKNFTLMEKVGKSSLAIAQKLGYPETIKTAAKILEEVALNKKDYKKAYAMQTLFYQMADSISSTSIKETTIQRQYQYEYEKQHVTDSLSNVKNQEIKEIEYQQEINQQKTYTFAGIIGLFFLLVIIVVIYIGFKNKKKSNVLLENKNKLIEQKNLEITDSITYAKQIQDTILPTHKAFNDKLKNTFEFYQPKDIVAGDFYWMQQVNDIVLYAAADCTGHGVPGALVSVVCHNALNQAVKEFNNITPADILNKTTELVIEAFSVDNQPQKIRDGMDIALCSIDFKNNKLQFAGANNPLYIVRNKELIEFKGDKQPVGYFYKSFPFKNHTIDIKKGDVIYTFTDGFPDQFGGENLASRQSGGKKFMRKRFKKLLISLSDLEMDKQHQKLESVFLNWKGDSFQVDDICVIGVKI